MSYRDYIPNNWDAFAVWMANFNAQLPALAAKYGISAAVVAQVAKDNDWVQYWVEARNSARQQQRQVNDYVDAVANGDLNGQVESNPTWALPASPADGVPNGIKKRLREIANSIKAQKSIYTQADGELLGIISPEEAGLVEENANPELKLRPLANFGIETDFRKFGMNSVKIEIRHKGENWQLAAFLNKSPGVFNVVPKVPDTAEQVEIRAIYLKNNETFGNFSPTYSVVIAP